MLEDFASQAGMDLIDRGVLIDKPGTLCIHRQVRVLLPDLLIHFNAGFLSLPTKPSERWIR